MTLNELFKQVNAQGDLNLFADEDNPQGIERTIDLTKLRRDMLRPNQHGFYPNIRVSCPWDPAGAYADMRSVQFKFEPGRSPCYSREGDTNGGGIRHGVETVEFIMDSKTYETKVVKVDTSGHWMFDTYDDRILVPYWMKAEAKRAVKNWVDDRTSAV